jgi:hypothetical protein
LLNDQDHFLNHIDFGAPSPGGDPSTDGCTWSKDIDAGDCVPGGGHEHLITEFGFDGCHGGGTAVTAPQGQYGGLVVDCCKPFSALVSIFNPSGPTCTINSVTINTLKTCFTPLPPCPCSSCCYEPLPHTLRVTWTPAGFLIDGANGTCGSKDTNCDTNIPTTFYLIPVAPDGDGYCKWQYTGGGYTVTSKMFNSLDGTCTGGNIDPYCDPATGLTHGVDAPASCVALTTITGPCFNLIYCGQGNCCQGVGGTLTGGTQTCCDEALDAGCSKPNFITLNWFP